MGIVRMTRIIFVQVAVAILAYGSERACAETLSFGRFGTVSLYGNLQNPANVVLFVSGDGGWNSGVVNMARELASSDALVIGIDIIHYLKQLAASKDGCSYAAADFEALSQFVQKKLGSAEYKTPVLVGYSSGATLVYAVLVQAPAGTFRGALSMGFCPDLPLTKPFCRGNGLEWKPGPKGKGHVFLPDPKLATPWIAFQGTVDQVCSASAVESYVKQVGQGRLVLLPKVGHGFSVLKNWLPQFKQAFLDVIQQQDEHFRPAEAPPVRDLPLVEIPAKDSSRDALAVMVSGDGGWAGLDRGLGGFLAGRGVPVIGLNSLRYFWHRRTPEEAAKDLERILRHYLTTWNKRRAILVGYSLGADVLPFMASRLSADLISKVNRIVLLGPSHTADFEFHVADWLGEYSRKTDLPVLPEVGNLRGKDILCLQGEEEGGSLCADLAPGQAQVVKLKGGHRFSGDYEKIGEVILAGMR